MRGSEETAAEETSKILDSKAKAAGLPNEAGQVQKRGLGELQAF